jgi:hypothetical protein
MDTSRELIRKVGRSMKKTPFGIVHLGSDGIFRSLDWDRTVLDAVPLTPEQIHFFLTYGPDGRNKDNLKTQQAKMKGIDGTRVPREQWYSPDPSMLPPIETDEETIDKMVADDPERYRQIQEEFDREWEAAKAERKLAGTL